MPIINSFKKALKGEEKLWIAFWLWFVALLFLGIISNATIIPIVYYPIIASLPLEYVPISFATDCLITVIFRSVLILIIWKCANNTKNKVWFYSARIIAIAFAIFTIYGSTRAVFKFIEYNGYVITKQSQDNNANN